MAAKNAESRWISGPFWDLLMGCGLIYCFAFVGLTLYGSEMRRVIPLEYTPWLLLFTGIPHYGATLLRVYQHRADRRRYAFFGVWMTALLWGLFVVSAYYFTVGSLLLTVYLTWSPWHYSGQNYGIAVMFLRRRGVALTTRSKRLFQASFVLSFVLTALAFHGERPGAVYAPGEYDLSVYEILPLGIPYAWVRVLIPVCAVAYLVCLLASTVSFLRVARLRDLGPSLLLAGSQALWFSIPVLARYGGALQGVEPFSNQHAAYAFMWIAVAHATQYVWITHYYARRVPSPPSNSSYLLQTILAGAAIWVVPAVLFAPGLLGVVPFDAGMAILVAATVNLHHFILDGAIWKLRDGRIASILLRGQTDEDAVDEPGAAGAWIRRGIWIAGAVSIVILAVGTWERVINVAGSAHRADAALEAGDTAQWEREMQRIERAHDRLAWMGRESSRVHVEIATRYLQMNKPEAAQRHVDAAARTRADWWTLANLGVYFQNAGQVDRALATTREAYALKPDSAQVAANLAWLLVQREAANPESIEQAIALAEQAVRSASKARYLYFLSRAYEAGGRIPEALGAARAAESRARAEGDPGLRDFIRYRRWLEQR